MNSRDKNHLPDYFIFLRREEEKRRLLLAWKTGITGPYLCLPGRKRGRTQLSEAGRGYQHTVPECIIGQLRLKPDWSGIGTGSVVTCFFIPR